MSRSWIEVRVRASAHAAAPCSCSGRYVRPQKGQPGSRNETRASHGQSHQRWRATVLPIASAESSASLGPGYCWRAAWQGGFPRSWRPFLAVEFEVGADICRLESQPLSDPDRHKVATTNQRIHSRAGDSEHLRYCVDRKERRKSVRVWR